MTKTVLRTLVLTLAVMTFSTSADAAGIDEERQLIPRTWSVQAFVTDSFDLENPGLLAVSLKHQFTKSIAVRAGVYVARDTDTREFIYVLSENNTNGFGANFLYYPVQTKAPKFYLAAGSFVFLKDSEGTYSFAGSLQERRSSTSTILGFSGLLGIEWFPVKQLSLFAEYGLEFHWSDRKTTTTSVDTGVETVRESGGWGDSRSPLYVGLSYYF